MHHFHSSVLICTEESQTVPDQSLSVRDILTRFTRGTISMSDIARPVYYEDDADDYFESDDFGNDDYDISVLHDAVHRYKQRIDDINQRIKELENQPIESNAHDNPAKDAAD